MKTERLTRAELISLMVEKHFIPRANVAQLDRLGELYDAGAPATVIGLAAYVLTGKGDVYGDAVAKAIRAAEERKSCPEVSQTGLKATLSRAGYSEAAVNAVTKAVKTHPAAGKEYRLTA